MIDVFNNNTNYLKKFMKFTIIDVIINIFKLLYMIILLPFQLIITPFSKLDSQIIFEGVKVGVKFIFYLPLYIVKIIISAITKVISPFGEHSHELMNL